MINSKLRSAAMLGSQNFVAIVLVFIGFILIGLLHDFAEKIGINNKGEMFMKTKMRKIFIVIISVLNSVWTMNANLLAGMLLA